MTNLIRLNNNKPVGHAVSEENFRMLFPDTSFPAHLTPADVEPFGFGLYEFTIEPTPGKHQKVLEGEPTRSSSGIWHQAWVVADMTQDERAAADAEKAEAVRQERARRLSACDWTQLPDASVDADVWATYRQALRDVTKQQDFPWDVRWPALP